MKKRPAGRMTFQNRVINPVVRLLLRSPAHRPLSGRVALITVTGRRTGRRYTTPVMYARDGDTVHVLIGAPRRKTWWHNVRRPAPARLLIAGRELTGTAELLDAERAQHAMAAYRARFPRSARAAGPGARLVRIRLWRPPEPRAESPRNRRVLVDRHGGPEVLRLVEEPMPEPGPGEARVRVVAAGVSFTDLLIREGVYPGGPRPPFSPGYEVVGTVDAHGPGTTGPAPGETVAALLVHGGYEQYVCVPVPHLVPVPAGVDPAEAAALVFPYMTAYQLLHRAARARPGDRVLVQGAAGAVGSAALQLGRVAGLKMYGTAATAQTGVVADLGAVPIDYVTEDVVARVRRETGTGADIVLDGIGGGVTLRSWRAARPGGRLVLFGHYAALSHGRRDLPRTVGLYAAWLAVLAASALPRGRRVGLYRIARLRDRRPDWFRRDLAALFGLLAEGRITPIIAGRLPLEDAADAQERVGRGEITGRLILTP